jgi:hypothetical protein
MFASSGRMHTREDRCLGRRLSIALAIFVATANAGAEVVEISPGADVRSAIAALKAGDELILRGGVYTQSTKIVIDKVGTSQLPYTIRAKEGENVLIELNTASDNLVEVQGASHVKLRGIRFRGGSHGIRLMSSSSFITIENCEIFATADVAISANSGGTYEGLVLRSNHIHHTNGTGEGMYLGCNSDACRVLNSIIEWNYIHHTNGPTVEQGDGIELKEGSAGNVIRHNVIHDTNYPGILTYSARGNGGPNIIEGNVIWNTRDYGIQSAADAIIRNNILVGSSMGLQAHQAGSPSNHTIVHNTIITAGDALEVRNVVGTVVIANNAIYSRDGAAIRLVSGDLSKVTLAGNVGSGGLSGASSGYSPGKGIAVDFVAAHYNGAPPIDLFPRDGSALIGTGSSAHAVELDFNGQPRNGTRDVGAYKFQSGGNPGWAIQAAFKAQTAQAKQPNPPTDLRVQ